MKRIAAFSLGFFFAAPALAVDTPQPVPAKSVDLLPGSTIKVGQGVNAAYRIVTQAGQTSDLWLHTDCQTRQKNLLFINTQMGDKVLRIYSTDFMDRYAAGKPFEPDARSPLVTKPELDPCRQNIPEPEWRGIASWHQPGEKLYLDRANSQRKGALLQVRLAIDYDKIHREEKYGAPYSVKIQDVVFNCERPEGRLLTTFLLDNQGVVSASDAEKNSAFSPLPAEMAGVANALCNLSDITRYAGNGSLVWRDKAVDQRSPELPDFEHNTPAALQRFAIPAEVTSVIEKTFADAAQKPAFRTIQYTQSGPGNDDVGLSARIDAQPDGTTLTIVKMPLANLMFHAQYQSLFNMVDVRKWETMSQAPWVSQTLENNVVLPPRPGGVYASHSMGASQDEPEKKVSLSQRCVAGKEWHDAARINPKFPGRYLEFICREDLGDGRDASSDYAYFEALKVFIRIGYQSSGQPTRFTFSEVDIR